MSRRRFDVRRFHPFRLQPLARVLVCGIVVTAPFGQLRAAPAAKPAAKPEKPAGKAKAQLDGNRILAALDKRAESFGDLSYSASMKITRGGRLERELGFDMVIKGLDHQYVAFTRPGDVAGMRILLMGVDSMWMYSPEFKKVRKVAAHLKRQGFLGSEFTPEDLATSNLAGRFEATIKSRASGVTVLTLKPKPGVEFGYSRLELKIEAAVGGVSEVKYFDASGKVLRVQSRAGWKKIGKIPVPTKITMTNLVNGNATVVELAQIRANTGVPDSFFSKRTLLRGHSR